FPDRTTLLVDTSDTLGGVDAAVHAIRRAGLPSPSGVRLDSGDLGALAVRTRRILDDAGMQRARIVASGGLDEHRIAELRSAGAPIDVYGVGTKMGVSADAPYLDSAYKLVQYGNRPVMKLSAGKATAPCAKQVHRGPRGDLVALRDEPPPGDGSHALLVPVMRAGSRTTDAEPLADLRGRCAADIAALPERITRLRQPDTGDVRFSARLEGRRDHLRAELVHRAAGRGRHRA
ncbi:MAG TPA: hypothetical protein VIL71_05855, partial [Spirillospora sp.]